MRHLKDAKYLLSSVIDDKWPTDSFSWVKITLLIDVHYCHRLEQWKSPLINCTFSKNDLFLQARISFLRMVGLNALVSLLCTVFSKIKIYKRPWMWHTKVPSTCNFLDYSDPPPQNHEIHIGSFMLALHEITVGAINTGKCTFPSDDTFQPKILDKWKVLNLLKADMAYFFDFGLLLPGNS